jgi:hypothetical protein
VTVMEFVSSKKIGRTVGSFILTALLFSLSVTTFASARDGDLPQKGLVYRLSTAATLASAVSDAPADPLPIPDFLIPRKVGFLLPDEEELNEYKAPPVVVEPGGDFPAASENIEPVFTTVPESKVVGDEYFADAVFIGDSRTVGMMTYSGVKSHYYAKVSLNIFSVLHTAFLTPPEGGDKQLTVLEALEKYPVFKKIYICFGINELGYNPTAFINAYEYFLDRVMALLPDSTIYIQAILPVSEAASARNRYGVNNEAVVRNNTLLYELAEKKGVYFVNVYEKFAGEDGTLDPSLAADGIHLSKAGIKMQMDYLRTHTVTKQTVQASANITD